MFTVCACTRRSNTCARIYIYRQNMIHNIYIKEKKSLPDYQLFEEQWNMYTCAQKEANARSLWCNFNH